MRQIRVSYRAVFQQLKSVAMKCNFPVDVEIIERKGQWICIAPETGVDFRFTPMQSAESAKKEAISRFETMLSDGWWIVGKPPDSKDKRLLNPEEFAEKDGKIYFYDLNDYTHIADPKKAQPNVYGGRNGAKEHPALCGDVPLLTSFVSLNANIEPSCPRCAEIYRKEYARK